MDPAHNLLNSNAFAPCVVLECCGSNPASMLAFREPRRVLRAWSPDEVGPALEAARAALRSGQYIAGYFSYELGYLFEPRLAPRLPASRRVPLLWLGVFDRPE